MKRICIIVVLLLAFCSCTDDNGNLYKVASAYLPGRLETAMTEYMGTVGKPTIDDMEPVYVCDSVCVLQCRASGKDRYGKKRSDTVRYIFVLDVFQSKESGHPVYYDRIQGARYLNRKEKKDFKDKVIANGSNQYAYFMGMCDPVDSF